MPGYSTDFDSDNQLAIGRPAPDFNLPGVDGRNYSLDDFKGRKALVVIFSCNHCPYVIKQEDRMIALGREYMAKDVGFVLISANDVVNYPQDSPANMKKRAEQKGYPFPYLYNEAQDAARAYGAQVTPHVFLFDGDMILRFRGAIDVDMDNPSDSKGALLRDALDAVLAGNPEKIADTRTRAIGCSIKWK